MSKPLWAKWFVGRIAIRTLPADCIKDCSAQGAVDDAVDYWVRKLGFEAPPWLLRDYLRSFGAWDSSQLCDHQANLRRLLWSWACDCKRNGPDYPLYLGV